MRAAQTPDVVGIRYATVELNLIRNGVILLVYHFEHTLLRVLIRANGKEYSLVDASVCGNVVEESQTRLLIRDDNCNRLEAIYPGGWLQMCYAVISVATTIVIVIAELTWRW